MRYLVDTLVVMEDPLDLTDQFWKVMLAQFLNHVSKLAYPKLLIKFYKMLGTLVE